MVTVAAAMMVLAVAASVAPRSARRASPLPGRGPAEALGHRLRAAARRRPDAQADRTLGSAVLWAAAATAVLGPAGIVFGIGRISLPVVRRRRQQRRGRFELWRQLPESADLIALCLSAGLPVTGSVGIVARAIDGPVGAALTEIDRRHRGGQRYAGAVDAVMAAGDEALRPLLAAIGAAQVDGGPAADAVRRLATDQREQRRRLAEADARRVPVLLLFPLVFCIVPAFVLIAIVPLVAGSAAELSFP